MTSAAVSPFKVESREDAGRNTAQGLARRHDLQVVVDPQPEEARKRMNEVRVLARRHVDDAEAVRIALELADDRRELDDLGTSAKQGEYRERTS